MSSYGEHPRYTREDARKARESAGLKPCRRCEYWYMRRRQVVACTKCTGDKAVLEQYDRDPNFNLPQ